MWVCPLPDGLVKNALEVTLGQGRAFEVLVCPDLLGAVQGLLVCDGLHSLLAERLEGGRVFPQVKLGADEDDGGVGGMVADLGTPLIQGINMGWRRWGSREMCVPYLGLDVVKRRRAYNGEADEEHVGLGVGQGP